MTDVADYDYHLPGELIAQHPLPKRSDARLLVVDRRAETFQHRHVRDLPDILRRGDCLALNVSQVVPARLIGRRTLTGGLWEGLYLGEDTDHTWRILCRCRGKLQPGDQVTLQNSKGLEDARLVLLRKDSDGIWNAALLVAEKALPLLARVGRVPLPPYIRHGEMEEYDIDRYQTVYALAPGSVAAPTAGLHFTPALLDRLAAAGISRAEVTLHVGIGTFRPIHAQRLEDHTMHGEWGEVSPAVVETLQRTREKGGRIVAVGTTAVRLLETAAKSGQFQPWSGKTSLFVGPGHQFRAVDALLTNFHLPRSTLLVLVRAFGGNELIREAYEVAIRERYRFYSYGDAMLIV